VRKMASPRILFKHIVAYLLTICFVFEPVMAQTPRGLPLVRDTEIERLMADYARPVLQAAKLGDRGIEITLINDKGFNAFVMDGRRIFITVGAIMQAQKPNEIIGVLAHETGHIAGGHLARLRQQLANAQVLSVIAMLLGAGAVAAGAVTGSNQAIEAAPAILLGPQEAIRRSMLSYQRAEEQAADRSALTYLAATGQSGKGMLTTFKRFADEGLFISKAVDPYALSHPMPQERIASLEALVTASPHYNSHDSAELQTRHDLARAKLYGFIERSDTVMRRYPPHDTSLAARYARAISAYRFGGADRAMREIDSLLEEQPRNGYFWELKGQALLENGRPREAISALRKAVSLAPHGGLIRGMLGHALLSTDDDKLLDEAMRELKASISREPDAAETYQHLAIAYAKKGDIARAELNTAQAYSLMGEWENAREQAARAQRKFPDKSPEWLKAEDIIKSKRPKN
jgi:predicted Zn-dependent protease